MNSFKTFLIILVPLFIIARPYQVPIGSKDNTIQLSINNRATADITKLNISTDNIPEFIEIDQINKINSIDAGKTGKVKYKFAIEKNAQIDSLVNLKFNINGENTVREQKIISIKITAPKKFELYHNYPNPFNPVTNIKYTLPEESKVNLTIYNLTGQQVKTLVQKSQEAGIYTQTWNASKLASGVYFYRIQVQNSTGIKTETRKMLLVK